MRIEDVYDAECEAAQDLKQQKIDLLSYVRMVDLLAPRVDRDGEGLENAAGIIFQYFVDLLPFKTVLLPRPRWFNNWIELPEVKPLHDSISRGLGALVSRISKANANSNACWLDESTMHDSAVGDMNDIVVEAIAKIRAEDECMRIPAVASK